MVEVASRPEDRLCGVDVPCATWEAWWWHTVSVGAVVEPVGLAAESYEVSILTGGEDDLGTLFTGPGRCTAQADLVGASQGLPRMLASRLERRCELPQGWSRRVRESVRRSARRFA